MNVDRIMMSIKIPRDVRAQLEAWAQRDLTTMTSELVRSVRMRAEREKREAAAA